MTDGDTKTLSVLTWYVQAVGEDADILAATSNAEATALVMNFVGAENPFKVPTPILSRSILEVGADLYYRKSTRNGITSFGGGDMPSPEPFRINRDPMAAAYPLLRPFLVIGL